MTRKQQKALQRSKAIKRRQNIMNNGAKSVAAVAVASAAIAAPNISAQDSSAQATIEEIVVTSRKKTENLVREFFLRRRNPYNNLRGWRPVGAGAAARVKVQSAASLSLVTVPSILAAR